MLRPNRQNEKGERQDAKTIKTSKSRVGLLYGSGHGPAEIQQALQKLRA